MPIILRAALVVTATVIALLLVRSVLRRAIPSQHIEEAAALGDMVMEALAGLYGVLVAFMLSSAWDRLDDMRSTLATEINAIADLDFIASLLPPPTNVEFSAAVDSYRTRVLAELELAPAQPAKGGPVAAGITMINTIASFEPQTAGQTSLQALALETIRELVDQRRIRLYAVQPLPYLVWFILIGGAITVLGLVAISTRSRFGTVYLTFLTVIISLALFTIYALSYPARSGLLAEMLKSV